MVIFDLDGTLIDTLPDIAEAFNRVLSGEGFPTHPPMSYKSFVGWGLRRTLELSLPGNMPEKQFEAMLGAVVNEYESAPDLLSKPYEGIPELLEELMSRHIPIAVLTNKSQNIAQKIVDRLLPRIKFIQVVGAQDSRPLKPNPAGIHELKAYLQDTGCPVLMVGDSPVDRQTAENAAIDFCAVLWGYRSEDELKAAGSTTNVRTPGELRDWILEKEEKER